VAETRCVPGDIAGSVMLDVEDGVDCATGSTPAATPSTVNVTVPEGGEAPSTDGVMLAVTGRVAPKAGVVVVGITTKVVGVRATVIVTVGENEPL
jgi:hypothetical protein